MKTYKLNHTTREWFYIIENCEIQMTEKGKSQAEIDAILYHLNNPQKHSKTKSLYQMSDETAEWLQYELTYRIEWLEGVIFESDSWSAYEHRLDLGQINTLLRQLEAQI